MLALRMHSGFIAILACFLTLASAQIDLCTPSPTPYPLANPSFEKGTFQRADPWKKTGVVNFPTDPQGAQSGKRYASLDIPTTGANTSISQRLTNLAVGQRYVLHFYFNILHYHDARGSSACYLVPKLGAHELGVFHFLAPTSGYTAAQFDVTPTTSTAPLSILAYCSGGRTFRGATIALDALAFALPPSNCNFTLAYLTSNSSSPAANASVVLANPSEDGTTLAAGPPAAATLFALDEYGHVFNPRTGYYLTFPTFEPIGFVRADSLAYAGGTARYETEFLSCGFPGTAGGQLECQAVGDTTQPPQEEDTVFAYCTYYGGGLFLGTENAIGEDSGCGVVELQGNEV